MWIESVLGLLPFQGPFKGSLCCDTAAEWISGGVLDCKCDCMLMKRHALPSTARGFREARNAAWSALPVHSARTRCLVIARLLH